MTIKKYNSINDSMAQQMRMNNNIIEILTKIDQSLNTNESYLTVKTTDESGKTVETQLITIANFKQQLDQIRRMTEILSGVDGNPVALQLANNEFKRIVVSDINVEPKQINNLIPITTFKSDPNLIFDAMLNPKISVEIDLTGKIDAETKTIEAKRFIVDFDKTVTYDELGNENLELTDTAKIRLSEFETKYKGKSDIDILEFITLLDSPGLINRIDDTLIDQDYFRIEPNRLQKTGSFTILSTDIDTINKKMLHILDTLTYYDITTSQPKPIELKVGDLVNVNPNSSSVKSTTVYKVVEISTITSENRVRFELMFGREPIPVKYNAISIYSDKLNNRSVKISIGYDEYSVIFLKALNDNNNIIAQELSPGIGILSNELKLDTNNGETFSEYYIKNVYDYGLVLEDLVQKKIPNYYGIKPNAPVLDINNFKVVQTNKHLTNTVEAEKIRDNYNKKNDLDSQISQIQESINKKNRIVQTTEFESSADKKRVEDEVFALQQKLNTTNEQKITLVSNIIASKKNINKINPTFSLRGFFPFPAPVVTPNTTPQEVVQFEILAKKTSKSGDENPILTIQNLDNTSIQNSSTLNTTVNANLTKQKTVNATYSNLYKIKSDSRKRTQDPITKELKLVIEDVSDANTPNINQVEIDINPGERIELKIKSLSEVGWPESPIESDFSNSITIDFPDDLNNILSSDEFILKEAQADEIKIKFDRDLEAKGLGLHLNSSIRIEDIYYAHKDTSIITSFKDNNGKLLNLYDQLYLMLNKINSLEQQINKAKGILEVYLVNNITGVNNKTRIFNGNIINLNVNVEDYLTKTKVGLLSSPIDHPFSAIAGGRVYKNELIEITNYSLLIKNNSENTTLGLLSNRGYGTPNNLTPTDFTYQPHPTLTTRGIQATFVNGLNDIEYKEISSNSSSPVLTAPYFATQQNNQFVLLQVKDINNNFIYDSVTEQLANDFFETDYSITSAFTNGANKIHSVLISTNKNLGILTGANQTPGSNAGEKNIKSNQFLEINEINAMTSSSPNVGGFATTVHPSVELNTITDTSSQLIKLLNFGDDEGINIPIKIYAKPYTGTSNISTSVTTSTTDGKFIDTATTASANGDMPIINTGTDFSVPTANQLNITFNAMVNGTTLGARDLTNVFSNNTVTLPDFVLINGLTGDLSSLNNKLLRVLNITATVLTVETNLGSPSSMTQSTAVLKQIHKAAHPRTGQSNSTRNIVPYNVYGQVGSDERYVNNYIVIQYPVTPSLVHNKKLRFFFEDENSARPFDLQLNFNISQRK